jgi:hypothetical protein
VQNEPLIMAAMGRGRGTSGSDLQIKRKRYSDRSLHACFDGSILGVARK